MFGEDMGNYVTVETTASDADGRPSSPGAINGGFFPVKPGDPPQFPSIVIAVDDIKESADRVRNSGGKVLMEPVDIPGVGKYLSFTDTEGNRLSLLQRSAG